jgi:hypothetical protein
VCFGYILPFSFFVRVARGLTSRTNPSKPRRVASSPRSPRVAKKKYMLLVTSLVALAYYAPGPLLHPSRSKGLAQPLSIQMQMMKPGDWTCEECGASPNFARRTECFKCGAPRPGGSSGVERRGQPQREQWPSSRGPDFKQGDWTCDECGASPVFASRVDCFRCGAPRPSGAGSSQAPEFRENFEGTRCFVENLSFDTDWKALKDAFSYEGYPIVYASVSTERDTGRSKGHGIVQFETAHAAEHAIAEMTGYELDGRAINVRPDYQERDRRGGGARAGGSFGGGGYGGDVEEEAFDDVGDAMGRRGDARPGAWRTNEVSNAAGKDAWKSREWTRVAGTGDAAGALDVDEEEVQDMLLKRDEAREKRDFDVADGILDELLGMGISLDDARRQRVWWVGRRADGKVEFRRATANPSRRQWYTGGGGNAGERDGDDRGRGSGGRRSGGRGRGGGWRGNDKFGSAW